MPIIIPDGKLLSREQAAELLDMSASTLKVRGGDTECLLEIRQTKKVQFNPHQIAAHREAVWNYGKCDGRCKSALQSRMRVTKLREVS
jgi:hypothetical protein